MYSHRSNVLRTSNRKIKASVFILAVIVMIFTIYIRAEAEDVILPVLSVRDETGYKSLWKSNTVYYTNKTLFLKPDCSLLFEGEQYQYAYSEDEGNSFCNWIPYIEDSELQVKCGEKPISYLYCFRIRKENDDDIDEEISLELIQKQKYPIYTLVLEKREPDISMSAEKDISAWQNQNFKILANIQDVWSGISEITCLLNQKEIYQKSYSGQKTIIQKADIALEAKLESIRDTGNELTIIARDLAGNESLQTYHYYLDKTAPNICLVSQKLDRIMYEPMHLKTKIIESNFKSASASMHIQKELDGVYDSYDQTIPLTEELTTIDNTFAEDGNYIVTVNAVDAAGNQAKEVSATFSVDVTPPVVTINGITDKDRYGHEVTPEIVISESFYNTLSVNIQMSRTINNHTQPYDFGKWSNTGKVSSLKRTISENGIYKMAVYARDAAGNETVSDIITFTIDKSLPVLAIEGIMEGEVTNQEVILTMAAYAHNRNCTVLAAGVMENLEGQKKKLKIMPLKHNGEYYTAVQKFQEEGFYTILLQAVDESGMGAMRSITFIIDKSPPEIEFLDAVKSQNFQSFHIPENIAEYIIDMTVFSVKIIINGIEYAPGEEISQQGHYKMEVVAKDQAGNEAIDTAEFTIGIDLDQEDKSPKETIEHIAVEADYAGAKVKGEEGQIKTIQKDKKIYVLIVLSIALICIGGVLALVLRLDTDKPIC